MVPNHNPHMGHNNHIGWNCYTGLDTGQHEQVQK